MIWGNVYIYCRALCDSVLESNMVDVCQVGSASEIKCQVLHRHSCDGADVPGLDVPNLDPKSKIHLESFFASLAPFPFLSFLTYQTVVSLP